MVAGKYLVVFNQPNWQNSNRNSKLRVYDLAAAVNNIGAGPYSGDGSSLLLSTFMLHEPFTIVQMVTDKYQVYLFGSGSLHSIAKIFFFSIRLFFIQRGSTMLFIYF